MRKGQIVDYQPEIEAKDIVSYLLQSLTPDAQLVITAVLADASLYTLDGSINRQKILKLTGFRMAHIQDVLDEIEDLRSSAYGN